MVERRPHPTNVVYADEDEPLDGGGALAPRSSPTSPPTSSCPRLHRSTRRHRHRRGGPSPPFVASGTGALEHECALDASGSRIRSCTSPKCCVIARRGTTRRRVPPGRRPGGGPPPPEGPCGGDVGPGARPHRLVRSARADGPVSILIPFRDGPAPPHLRGFRCRHHRRAQSVELVLIDNGSSDPETLTLMEHLSVDPDVRVSHDPRPSTGRPEQRRGARLAGTSCCSSTMTSRRSGGVAFGTVRPGAPARCGGRGPGFSIRTASCSTAASWSVSPGRLDTRSVASRGRRGLPAHGRHRRECSAVTGACLATWRTSSRNSRVSTRVSVSTSTTWISASAPGRRVLHALRAGRRARPPRIAEPGHGGRGRRCPAVPRSLEGLHCRGGSLPQPTPHPCRSVLPAGRPR